jgi:hypothetical protein
MLRRYDEPETEIDGNWAARYIMDWDQSEFAGALEANEGYKEIKDYIQATINPLCQLLERIGFSRIWISVLARQFLGDLKHGAPAENIQLRHSLFDQLRLIELTNDKLSREHLKFVVKCLLLDKNLDECVKGASRILAHTPYSRLPMRHGISKKDYESISKMFLTHGELLDKNVVETKLKVPIGNVYEDLLFQKLASALKGETFRITDNMKEKLRILVCHPRSAWIDLLEGVVSTFHPEWRSLPSTTTEAVSNALWREAATPSGPASSNTSPIPPNVLPETVTMPMPKIGQTCFLCSRKVETDPQPIEERTLFEEKDVDRPISPGEICSVCLNVAEPLLPFTQAGPITELSPPPPLGAFPVPKKTDLVRPTKERITWETPIQDLPGHGNANYLRRVQWKINPNGEYWADTDNILKTFKPIKQPDEKKLAKYVQNGQNPTR